jgi:hypothetical protein
MDEAAKTVEWWHTTFMALEPAKQNAVNCAYLVLAEMQGAKTGPRNKDRDADQLANAMLAFRRIGEPAVAPG